MITFLIRLCDYSHRLAHPDEDVMNFHNLKDKHFVLSPDSKDDACEDAKIVSVRIELTTFSAFRGVNETR